MAKKSPPAPGPDPIAERISLRRKALGWSLADLAREAGLKAPSYVLHIERGEKAPSEDVAARLALALGEDVDSFAAWARLRTSTSSLDEALHSARIAERAVRNIEKDKRHIVRRTLAGLPAAERNSAKIRLLKAEELPGSAAAQHEGKTLTLAVHVEAEVQKRFEDLVRPFAYLITRRVGRRAPGLLPPGFYAIVTGRVTLPLEAHEVYAVRVDGRAELGFVHWDGERLALLPHKNPNDLVLLSAASKQALRAVVIGKVAIVTQPEAFRVDTLST